MGSGPSAHLHVDGTTPLHRMPAHAKLVGLVAFVLLVVSVPPQDRVALVGLLLVAVGVLWSTRVPVRHLLPRLAVELPFVVFALLLPFVALGPQVELGPFTVSQSGLDAAVGAAAQGHLRGRGGRRLRRDDPTARPRARPAAPAGARHPRDHRGVHGPLRRRRRRPDAPDARGPGVARLHRPVAARLAAARRRAPGRSSSAATSAASGCTWPWSAAAGRAGCRSPRRSSRPRPSGPSPWRPRRSPPP